MQRPFTREQFFDVFAAHNATLWPGVVALRIASALVAVLLFARPHRASAPIVSTLLAIHWAWSALAYHMAFFTSINPAAWFFAALFLVEAVLFVWWGTVRGSLRFAAESSAAALPSSVMNLERRRWEYRIEHAAECAWTGEEADYSLGSGPADAPVLGRCAVLADPAGAQFGLIVARDGWVEVPNV